MEHLDPTFLVVAAAGLLLAVIRFLPLMMGSLNAPAFNAMIEKLLSAGNRDRALKLCNAAPNAPYALVVKAMLKESEIHRARDGEWLVAEAIGAAHKRAVAAQKRRLGKIGWLAPLGIVVASGATYLALRAQATPPPVVYLPPVLATLIWFACFRKLQRFNRYFAEALDKLRPLMTRYVMRSDG